MNLKIKSYAYIAIFVSTWLIAQQTTGVVMDTDGIPLSDVEIFEENTTHGTVSAIDGSFRIQLNALPATLHFKALGFASQNVTIEKDFELVQGSYELTMNAISGNYCARRRKQVLFDHHVDELYTYLQGN